MIYNYDFETKKKKKVYNSKIRAHLAKKIHLLKISTKLTANEWNI